MIMDHIGSCVNKHLPYGNISTITDFPFETKSHKNYLVASSKATVQEQISKSYSSERFKVLHVIFFQPCLL